MSKVVCSTSVAGRQLPRRLTSFGCTQKTPTSLVELSRRHCGGNNISYSRPKSVLSSLIKIQQSDYYAAFKQHRDGLWQ